MRISDWSSDVCSSDLRLIASGEDYGTHLLPAIARPSLFGMAHTSRTQGGTDRAARCHRPLAGDGREGDLADRTSVVSGKRVEVRVDLGGSSIVKEKN